VPLAAKTSAQCASSVISIPASLARICEPLSFWNFSAASTGGPNVRTPTIAAIAAIEYFFIADHLQSEAASVGSPSRDPTLLPSASVGGARRLIDCRAQSLGQFDGIVVGPEMHEEQPRLLIEHVTVYRSHLDAVGPKRVDHGIDFSADEHEIASDSGLAAARRLEVDGGGNARRTGRRNLHSTLGDCIPPWHAKRIDAGIIRPFCADDLVELVRVEINRRRCAGGWSSERSLARPQGRLQRGGHLLRIAVPADMQVKGHRLGAQQVVVNCRDLEAAFLELTDDGIDLGAEQYEIAHHHRHVAHRLEGRPPAEG